MTHIITSLCLRDRCVRGGLPGECIIAGKPEAQWRGTYWTRTPH